MSGPTSHVAYPTGRARTLDPPATGDVQPLWRASDPRSTLDRGLRLLTPAGSPDRPNGVQVPSRSGRGHLRAAKFSRSEILTAIRRWVNSYGAVPKAVDWDPGKARRTDDRERLRRFQRSGCPTVHMVRRQFGTMSAAIKAAGYEAPLTPTRPGGHRRSKQQILRAIQDWAERYETPPTMADWDPSRARRNGQSWRVARYYAADWPNLGTVLHHFGTFNAAIEAAGLPPRPRGRPQRREERDPTLQNELFTKAAAYGPAILADHVKAVAEARRKNADSLHSALSDLASVAMTWASALDRPDSTSKEASAVD